MSALHSSFRGKRARTGWIGIMNRLAKWIDVTGRTCAWLIALMVVIQVLVVAGRYLFAVNYVWMQEAVIALQAFLFVLVVGSTLARDRHVRIDLIGAARRGRYGAWRDRAGLIALLVPMALALSIAGFTYAMRAWGVLEGSVEVSGLPGVFLIKTLVPVLGVLLLAGGFVQAFGKGRNEGHGGS